MLQTNKLDYFYDKDISTVENYAELVKRISKLIKQNKELKESLRIFTGTK